MHISVHNSYSLQHTELKINIEIQEGSLYLTTNSVAMETLVMGVSLNKCTLNSTYRIDLVSVSKRFGISFERSAALRVQGRRQSRSRTRTLRHAHLIRRWALFRVHLIYRRHDGVERRAPGGALARSCLQSIYKVYGDVARSRRTRK